jgi:hypothetical protein
VVGWQVEKWVLGQNILLCEHKVMCDNDLGRGNILKKFARRKFVAPASGSLAAIHQNSGDEEQRARAGVSNLLGQSPLRLLFFREIEEGIERVPQATVCG